MPPAVAELQALLDERGIHRILLQYCRGIDRLDLDLVRSCYHPDATDSHGSFSGDVEAFLAWVGRILPRSTRTHHLLANVLVDLDPVRPGRARAESYGVAIHEGDPGIPERNLVTGFRFVDDFVRHAERGWRIQRRVATTEWVRRTQPEDGWPIPEGLLRGSRDGSDPLYAPAPWEVVG